MDVEREKTLQIHPWKNQFVLTLDYYLDLLSCFNHTD